ncbi:MAG: 16S rRNA (cytosine(1402)-N(4))-methyltransferase RsmH [Flavobacteriaceae bacterium]|jgi:16S rRNA (cytosine1402-N4)-methyltransferase
MYHKPVLLTASLEGLALKKSGTYVDATFGGGGHTKAILSHLGPEGKVVAFDQDEDALVNQWEDDRLLLVHQNFRYLQKFLRFHNIDKVDGVLADLGVSSYQLDTPDRGFSIRFEGPLDMRMSQNIDNTAEKIINTYDETSLGNIFYRYGELRSARRFAAEIINQRKNNKITTTQDLIELLKPMIPQARFYKELAQIFQALRIEVNQELSALESLLEQTAHVLNPQGRLCVISYHSLEDRLVKRYMKYGCFDNEPNKDAFGNSNVPFKKIGKMLLPQAEEIKSNKRARSAKLRIAEKT